MFPALPILEVSSPVVPSRALALALPQSSRLSISRGDSDYLNLLSSIDEGCLPPLIPSPSAKSRPKVLMITSQTSVPRFTRVENCVFLTFFGCGAPPHCTSQSQPTQPVLSHHWADPRRDRSCSSRCRQRFASKLTSSLSSACPSSAAAAAPDTAAAAAMIAATVLIIFVLVVSFPSRLLCCPFLVLCGRALRVSIPRSGRSFLAELGGSMYGQK